MSPVRMVCMLMLLVWSLSGLVFLLVGQMETGWAILLVAVWILVGSFLLWLSSKMWKLSTEP